MPAPQELAKRLRVEIGNLQTRRDAYLAARTEHLRRLEAAERQIERLRSDVARLRAHGEAQAVATAERRAQLDELEARRGALGASLGALREETLKTVRTMRSRVEAGVPFRRHERLAAFAAVGASLENEDPVEQAKGVEDFWRVFTEELQLARTRELRNELIALDDGTEKHAFVAQLGLATLLYVTEDGASSGVCGRGASPAWTPLTGSSAARVREVLEILKRRRVPRILAVPFPVAARRPPGREAGIEAGREPGEKTAAGGGKQ